MTRFNNHSEDLSNLVLLMRLQVTEQEGVELLENQRMATDQTRDESHHKQFDLIPIIRLAELSEQFLNESLWIEYEIDGEEIRRV
jgi:hypothetical protein